MGEPPFSKALGKLDIGLAMCAYFRARDYE